jgi:hypothetical protein
MAGLFEVDNASFAVGVETCFFDDVVKLLGSADFFESEFGVGFVCGNQHNRTNSDKTIGKTAMQTHIHNAIHINIINSLFK